MPNVAVVLKEEITRLARKEMKQQVDPLKKTVAEQRRTIADLKRQVSQLSRNQTFLQTQEKRRLSAEPEPAAAVGVRFSPKWLKADRARLGVSAKDYGRLVGVTPLTIYHWESGKAKPRAKALAAWAAVRGIGKREATKRLELLAK
jgi:DNA-binding transcriptional regulator YiaG